MGHLCSCALSVWKGCQSQTHCLSAHHCKAAVIMWFFFFFIFKETGILNFVNIKVIHGTQFISNKTGTGFFIDLSQWISLWSVFILFKMRSLCRGVIKKALRSFNAMPYTNRSFHNTGHRLLAGHGAALSWGKQITDSEQGANQILNKGKCWAAAEEWAQFLMGLSTWC